MPKEKKEAEDTLVTQNGVPSMALECKKPSAKKQVIAELAVRVVHLEENLLALADLVTLAHAELSDKIEDLRARLNDLQNQQIKAMARDQSTGSSGVKPKGRSLNRQL